MDEELVKVDQVIDQYQADQEALVEILREINAASGASRAFIASLV